MKCLLGILVLATILLPNTVSAELVLVENGEPRCQIIISPDATPVERYAAKELQQALAKATGAM